MWHRLGVLRARAKINIGAADDDELLRLSFPSDNLTCPIRIKLSKLTSFRLLFLLTPVTLYKVALEGLPEGPQ